MGPNQDYVGIPELADIPEIEEEGNRVQKRGVWRSILTWILVFLLLVCLCYVGMYLVISLRG